MTLFRVLTHMSGVIGKLVPGPDRREGQRAPRAPTEHRGLLRYRALRLLQRCVAPDLLQPHHARVLRLQATPRRTQRLETIDTCSRRREEHNPARTNVDRGGHHCPFTLGAQRHRAPRNLSQRHYGIRAEARGRLFAWKITVTRSTSGWTRRISCAVAWTALT